MYFGNVELERKSIEKKCLYCLEKLWAGCKKCRL